MHYVSNQDKTEDGKVYIPGEGYHTDHSNYVQPPKATALHAVKLPLTGGDTQFVNMYEAYNTLSDQTKRKIDGLKARHVYQSRFSERKLPKLPGQQQNIATDKSVTHPIVRAHPETGRRSLYINPIRIDEIYRRPQRSRGVVAARGTARGIRAQAQVFSTGTNGVPATS